VRVGGGGNNCTFLYFFFKFQLFGCFLHHFVHLALQSSNPMSFSHLLCIIGVKIWFKQNFGAENCTFSGFGEGNCTLVPGKKIVPIRILYTPDISDRLHHGGSSQRFEVRSASLQLARCQPGGLRSVFATVGVRSFLLLTSPGYCFCLFV
jgi:hypothetical protein